MIFSRKRNVFFITGSIFLLPVVYWYITEPFVAKVLITNGDALTVHTEGNHNGNTNDKDACQFPDFDPFHPDAMRFFKKYPTTSCPNGMPTITYFNGEEVKVNRTKKVRAFGNQRINCWYRDIMFKAKVDFLQGPWVGPFSDTMKVKGQPQYVEVKCQNDNGNLVSRMSHYITREELRQKSPPPKHQKNFQPNSLNVIMLCLDSMARHLLLRAMPKTKAFLDKNLESVELSKYNKVGGATFENLLALVGGIFKEDLEDWTQVKPMDELPFLWKDYKSAGYKTQYATDRPDFDNFLEQPTDSFNSPMAVALMQDKVAFNNNCFEDQVEVPMWLKLVLEFARDSLYTTGRFFSFVMLNRPTHDFPNEASAVDEHHYNFLKEAFETGLLNNTFLAVFGDHGPRIDAYRRTYYGSIEERATLMSIYLPRWFRQKYPQHFNNLLYNKNRLTTNFDVYETIKNLLSLETGGRLVSSYDDKNDKKNIRLSETGKQRAFSLFTKIPRDRTCLDAGITPHRCMCNGGVGVEKRYDLKKEIGLQVVKDLNTLLEPKSDLCSELRLKSVISLVFLNGHIGKSALYRIMITTEPSGAAIEATVDYSFTLYFFKSLKTLGIPSRMNMYRGQSDCVDNDKILKMFCYCKDLLSKNSNSNNYKKSINNGAMLQQKDGTTS